MTKKLIVIFAVVLIAAALVGAAPVTPVHTERQDALHEAAEILRAAGYTDEDAPVRALSDAWWAEQERLDILANLVDGEAGDCPWEHRVAVAVVPLNRERDERFPDTLREVIGQKDVINGRVVYQYTPDYLYGSNARRSSYEAAAAALNGEHNVPADVVWQAQFPQGTATWWVSEVDTGWYRSTTYFCR